MSNLHFGQKLRMIREQNGISLNAMARNLQVSSGYLSNLESGKTENVNLKILQEIPEVLGVDFCPICNHLISKQDVSTISPELKFRIERIYQEMLLSAEKDPIRLDCQLTFLEEGFFGALH